MNINAFPRWFLALVASAALLSGCPVPLPPTYDSASRQNVGEHIPDFIVNGETTRDDVLLRLGEPDGRGPGDRWFAYGSQYSKGGVLFVMAAGGGAGLPESSQSGSGGSSCASTKWASWRIPHS